MSDTEEKVTLEIVDSEPVLEEEPVLEPVTKEAVEEVEEEVEEPVLEPVVEEVSNPVPVLEIPVLERPQSPPLIPPPRRSSRMQMKMF